jgi:thiol:disulfide interchange protein DsbD
MLLRSLALLLSLLACGSVSAESRGFGIGGGQQEPDFLPVEQAFIASAEMKPGGMIHAHWDIADGYYLYRHALRFTLADTGGARLGAAQIPAGVQKEDE